jgi:hypothetical protein
LCTVTDVQSFIKQASNLAGQRKRVKSTGDSKNVGLNKSVGLVNSKLNLSKDESIISDQAPLSDFSEEHKHSRCECCKHRSKDDYLR